MAAMKMCLPDLLLQEAHQTPGPCCYTSKPMAAFAQWPCPPWTAPIKQSSGIGVLGPVPGRHGTPLLANFVLNISQLPCQIFHPRTRAWLYRMLPTNILSLFSQTQIQALQSVGSQSLLAPFCINCVFLFLQSDVLTSGTSLTLEEMPFAGQPTDNKQFAHEHTF